MAVRFEIARQIAGGMPNLFRPDAPPAPPPVPGMIAPPVAGMSTPAPPGTPAAPATPPVPVPDLRDRIVALFPAAGASTAATLAQATSAADYNTLFLSSPAFMRR